MQIETKVRSTAGHNQLQ